MLFSLVKYFAHRMIGEIDENKRIREGTCCVGACCVGACCEGACCVGACCVGACCVGTCCVGACCVGACCEGACCEGTCCVVSGVQTGSSSQNTSPCLLALEH